MTKIENKDSCIAIIPARGGSKRIPNKNINLFCGLPMISYSITTAKKTGLFDKVIVSTDSRKIATVAQQYGAKIPFLRPDYLADDMIGISPVIHHMLIKLKECHELPKYFCCILATAPLLKVESLHQGFKVLQKIKATTVVSVAKCPVPIFRSLEIKNGFLNMIYPHHRDTRSQDLPDAYYDAGQFYWGNTERFMVSQQLFTVNSAPVILPTDRVQDIDTQEDWNLAEIKYKRYDR